VANRKFRELEVGEKIYLRIPALARVSEKVKLKK
jgi:hypothetical protein